MHAYNQGSWVYVDAEEMEKVFNAAWDRAIIESDLPGVSPTPGTVSPLLCVDFDSDGRRQSTAAT
jgi:hypothetical protein